MRPSACYSPDLAWFFHDAGAACGESSALGASLERMALFGRDAWQPEPKPDQERKRRLPGEGEVIDPRDFFVDARRARREDMRRPKTESQFTAIPTTVGHSEPVAADPDLNAAARARRIARAWAKLTAAQRHKLWLAYVGGITWGTEAEHRAFRLASAADAEALIKELAGAA
jgi:hypothetical protein